VKGLDAKTKIVPLFVYSTMSISVGLISNNRGWILTDGRKHTAYELQNDILVKKREIDNDTCDKTFSVNKNFIGSVIGKLDINDTETSKVIKQFLAKENPATELNDILDRLSDTLLSGLNQDQSLAEAKEIECIIIQRNKGGIQLGCIEIRHNNGQLSRSFETLNRGDDTFAYQIFGDDDGRAKLKEVLDERLNNDTPPIEIKSILIAAISEGIKGSGIVKNGDHQSCGGEIFFRPL
jgi:hypothetical protein